jgi:hypothetical protein
MSKTFGDCLLVNLVSDKIPLICTNPTAFENWPVSTVRLNPPPCLNISDIKVSHVYELLSGASWYIVIVLA